MAKLNYQDDVTEEQDEPIDDPEEEANEDSKEAVAPVSIGSTSSTALDTKLPDTPAAVQHYKDLLEDVPLHSNYHPSKLRQILGIVAGSLLGTATASPKAGMNVAGLIRDAPYRRQLEDYQQQLDNAGKVANVSSTAQTAQYKQGLDYANQVDKLRHAEAEGARREAEGSRGAYYQGRTAALPGSYQEDLAGKEALARVNHPENQQVWKDLHIDDKTGTAIQMNSVTGEVRTTKYATPAEISKAQTGQLREISDAQRILADPTANPTDVSAAKLFIDNIKDQMNKRGTTIMIAPGQDGKPQTGIRVGGGTPIPAGAQTTAGVNTVNTGTSTTRRMIEAAPAVLNLSHGARSLIQAQTKSLGPLAGRWNDFMTGKVGAPNPEFAKLKTQIDLLTTALTNMHTGRAGGKYMQEHFAKMLEAGKQSPQNLIAALDTIDKYASDIKNSKEGSEGAPETSENSKDPLGIR